MFAPDELIAALSDGGVEYVLIGGLAVGAHGFPRATKDVDIVPAPDEGNLDRLANVLRVIEAHNFGTGDFDPAEFPFDPLKPDDLREGGNFVLGTRLGRLVIMQWVPGIPGDLAFEHLTRGAVNTSLGGRPVRICSRDDLVAMKRAAARSQDLLDLEELGSPDFLAQRAASAIAVHAFIRDPWSRAMPDTRAEIDEATAVVRWLLEAGLDGLGLTKTHALRRAVVREAAERWPHWWRHELFGPPHRESDLPVLAEVHAALRRLRLMRRRRETLLTTARGRELLADPEALVKLLHDDLGGDGFDGDAWLLIEEALHEHGPLESDRLTEIVGRLLVVGGWRDADGAWLEGWALFGALQPVLCRAEGYGLVRRDREPLTLELTAAGEGLAALEPPAPEPTTAAPGDAALVFDAELLNVRGVRARLAVLERQPLTALHDAIQQAFGWYDDHLYSFWLDGSFFGSDEVELTSPDMPDKGVATADVPLAELDLHLGQRIGYVFDFGDDWRVRLTVRERVTAEPGDHPRVLELRGTPPPQYATLDDLTS